MRGGRSLAPCNSLSTTTEFPAMRFERIAKPICRWGVHLRQVQDDFAVVLQKLAALKKAVAHAVPGSGGGPIGGLHG
jgi:hypothetical protein